MHNIGNKSASDLNGIDEETLKKWQSKECLVYCNAVEHFILHALILSNHYYEYSFTNNPSGKNRFQIAILDDNGEENKSTGINALQGIIIKWYINEKGEISKSGREYKNECGLSYEDVEIIIKKVKRLLIQNQNKKD
ncbi:hypothetical protein [Lactobacillus sp. Sy-1]|uniref:hypothetical protein n=1 Tax=Lactobacillus sp. Sy-1 TaxID=2109645 RepID=UPI001C5AD496|nr:hypothetical protein [Lactobacillus sp. Sy-1]MBW1606081.1 hypothetical protein [Lactobacillus sp. Sy-1]